MREAYLLTDSIAFFCTKFLIRKMVPYYIYEAPSRDQGFKKNILREGILIEIFIKN